VLPMHGVPSAVVEVTPDSVEARALPRFSQTRNDVLLVESGADEDQGSL
jgi:hypothetical protein